MSDQRWIPIDHDGPRAWLMSASQARGVVRFATVVIWSLVLLSLAEGWWLSGSEAFVWFVGFLLSVSVAGFILVIGQRIAAVTGRIGAARLVAGGGVGLVGLTGALAILARLADAYEMAALVAVLASAGSSIWIGAAVWFLVGCRPESTPGIRRFRQVVAGVLAASLLAGAVLGVLTTLVALAIDSAPPLALMLVSSMTGTATFAGLIGCAAVPLASRIARRGRHRAADSIDPNETLHLDCPECGKAFDAPRGESACPHCRSVVRVVIEEPRCTCGQVLFRLTGDECPECGEPVPGADQFSESRFTRGARAPREAVTGDFAGDHPVAGRDGSPSPESGRDASAREDA